MAAVSTSRLRQVLVLYLLTLFAASIAAGDGWTHRHEAGRCAIRGHCGKKSLFGKQLPCPDNGLAEEPDDDVRKRLVDVCGAKWSEGPVCCRGDQLAALNSNLKLAESLISACPACKTNFFDLFCTFTCSPDQSLFLNVSKTTKTSAGKDIVTEIDYLVSNAYGSGLYDSCKDVKNSATNGYAMDLIGGGAKNYTSFLKFLGDEKPLFGSPFQLNFPRPKDYKHDEMDSFDENPKRCNDEDERYRCSCVDCPSVCPKLPDVAGMKKCHVGVLPCLSFSVILIYAVFILALVSGVTFRVWQKHTQRKHEILRLLQDPEPSDDEDEGDVVHGAGMLDRPQKYYYLNTVCDVAFSRLAKACARFPSTTISISFLIIGLLSLGWINFAVETNPVRLWVSPTSPAAQEKAFFDSNFGPFYRAQQAFLVNDTSPKGPGPVLSYETLWWWFDVESRVRRLISEKEGVMFEDVCFKPVGDACVVQSLTGYFGGDFLRLNPNTWQDRLRKCTEQPVDCLPDFQQPLRKEMVLGGLEAGGDVLDAEALIATWVVNNHPEGTREERQAMDWEESLKSTLIDAQAEAKGMGLRLSFSTEISLEQEINKSTNTDAKIVVLSYVIMFIYASIALGSTTLTMRSFMNNPMNALVHSKFSLGVIGIAIVLMSVSASVGLFSAAGIKVTLIIAEVIPFLVLAVGVDNIFLIVHEFERVNLSHPDAEIEDRVARALGRMGPSILLSAITETVAFALGAFVGMPAVRNFAVYAAGAVVVNALLQVTMFVSFLALNQKRVESSRADCFPCFIVKSADAINGVGPHSNTFDAEEEGGLQRFIRKSYAPTLLRKKVKFLIVVGFLGLFTAGLALIPGITLGLDQRIAIPSDSYLISYFNDLDAYFDSGPPVYFVTRQLNVTERKHQQQLCGRFTTCNSHSLANVLESERKRPEVSFIDAPAASWIDDYFHWLNPALDQCCKEGSRVCFEGRDPAWNITLSGMPEGQEFIHYLEKWIEAPTGSECPIAGKAPYSKALVIDTEDKTIQASHFRTSHIPLRSQSDFIEAYASARRIARSITDRTDAEVFPYSKFYIFFDQYASIAKLTATLLGSAIAIIFLITSVLLGSIKTGLAVAATVVMIVVDVMGTMAVARVSLNAVSLVNLVICVGIGVEFCAHIARAFMFPSRHMMERARNKFRGKDVRAWTSLVNVGGSVLSGITITKLLGVCVLAFTRSKIFEIYYFRIWLALVFFAAGHALVFLPVVLSLIGGEGYVDPETDGGLQEDLASRRYRALLPDDEYDSDEYYSTRS